MTASARKVPFGVFLPVGNGGFIMSSTTPQTPGTYEYNREVTELAEELGLGFVVSMARWRGWGGSTGQWNRTIESITTTSGFKSAMVPRIFSSWISACNFRSFASTARRLARSAIWAPDSSPLT